MRRKKASRDVEKKPPKLERSRAKCGDKTLRDRSAKNNHEKRQSANGESGLTPTGAIFKRSYRRRRRFHANTTSLGSFCRELICRSFSNRRVRGDTAENWNAALFVTSPHYKLKRKCVLWRARCGPRTRPLSIIEYSC